MKRVLTVLLLVCAMDGRAADTPEALYLAALGRGDTATAITIAKARTAETGSDRRWLVALGNAQSLAGDRLAALDAFGRASAGAEFSAFDRSALRNYMQACITGQAYASARDAIALLVRRYPNSALSAADATLKLAIDKPLSAGATLQNLYWYRHQVHTELAASRPGACLVMAREYRLLARTMQEVPDALTTEVCLEAGLAAAEIGQPAAAWAWIEQVKPESDDGRAAIVRGMTLRALGRDAEARRNFTVALSSPDQQIRERASKLLR